MLYVSGKLNMENYGECDMIVVVYYLNWHQSVLACFTGVFQQSKTKTWINPGLDNNSIYCNCDKLHEDVTTCFSQRIVDIVSS